MNTEFLTLFGSLSVQPFGLFVALGVGIFIWLLQRDSHVRTSIDADRLSTAVLIGTVVGIAGGRTLYVLENYNSINGIVDIISIWDGGLSVLGAFIAILTVVPLYLRSQNIPIIALLDRVALYAPVAQALGRIGCFFAGCCHGIQTTALWHVVYTDNARFAPCNVPLHPTQLYSSLTLLCIFIGMQIISRRFKLPQGSLLSIYLMLAGIERFSIDFLRADHTPLTTGTLLDIFSLHQLLALCLTAGALMNLIRIYIRQGRHAS